jgi:hypothetical protein
LQAFLKLQTYLCSEPVVDYSRSNRPYALIVDASLGDDKKPGGLSAILTQINANGEHCVIAYASRKLQKHKCNYTPFLLEMQAAIWGMDHFATYLRGRKFTLITDHQPLEKLGEVHTKTLNRLQEVMNSYDFEIIYKKGSEMPADYLSRNIVSAISWDSSTLAQAQNADPLLKALKNFLLNKELPCDAKCQSLIKLFAKDCFIEDDIIWRRIKRQFEPSRVVIFLPASLKQEALIDAHGNQLVGHDGIYKMKERLLQCFYWPGMDADIASHLKSCHRCQLRRTDDRPPPALLSSLPQPTEPNQRIHADIFGPLKTSDSGKKFILCMTDALTKYVELVPLPNKEANTVANAIFDKWYCCFGAPLDIITDQGKEFCARLSDELFKRLGTNHLTTSPHHPQCNSQAEVAYKTIAKYLASFCDDSTLDWELYLAPLMFSYNTSFHRSIKNSPFFLTFGMEPRLPTLPTPDLRRKFYGESTTDNIIRKLLFAREVARQNNEDASDTARLQFDARAAPHKFLPQQLVLMDEHSFLHKNQKLAPKWSGPHRVLRLKGQSNVEIQLKHNNRKTVVHANRLKSYFVANKNLVVCPDFLQPEPPSQTFPDDVNPPVPEDYSPVHRTLLPNFQEVTARSPSPIAHSHAQIPVHTPCRTRTSSSSSQSFHPRPLQTTTFDDAPPAMRTRSCSHSSSPALNTTAKQKLLMPQVTFQPLPVLQEGEGLEEEEIEKDITEGMTINFVTGEDSWTLEQRRKKNKKNKNNKNEKWNTQQKQNFVKYSDIYQGEPYKNYRNVNIGPPLAIAQPQQQVVQQPIAPPQQLYPPIALPYIPPAPPVLPAKPPVAPPQLLPQPPATALQLPLPTIVITPPPKPFTPISRKRHRLEAIPEEDEPLEAHRPRLAELPSSSSSSADSSDEFNTHTHPNTPAKHLQRGPKSEDLPSAFGRLALSADANLQARRNRYCLTREEKEQLKFLGLQNLFNTSWPKPGLPRKELGRWKKN